MAGKEWVLDRILLICKHLLRGLLRLEWVKLSMMKLLKMGDLIED
jgi:hypothetical protein